MADTMLHKFEAAGLGKAPFRFVGVDYLRGPITYPNGTIVGYPGQPMGVCDFCGTSIVERCHIRSSDGKSFVVGNECVRKTGDAGLVNITKRELARKRTEERHKREASVIANLSEMLKNAELRAKLALAPHPMGWAGKNWLDWADWMLVHAGNAGKIKVARSLAKLEEVPA